jgi:FdhD protein
MDEHPPTKIHSIQRITDGVSERTDDTLVVEEPMEIRIRGKGIAVTMRTPGHDYELAAGFLVSEGIIDNFADVLAINHCTQPDAVETGNIVNVFLAPKVEVDLEKLTRHVFASSSCGLCGKATIDAVQQQFPAIENRPTHTAATIRTLSAKLARQQDVFASTGALHAAAIFDRTGDLIVLREDVGRHNTVDKAIGHGFLNQQLPFANHILLVSGRASFEILQKALSAGIPTIAAVSAPSHLAVRFAEQNNQTLIGFLRENRMNVYTGSVEA